MQPEMNVELYNRDGFESLGKNKIDQEAALPSRQSFLDGALRILSNLNPFTETSYHPGGPYFYASFASYHFPPRPVREMTRDQALEHSKSYAVYVAHFNSEGKIEQWENFLPDGTSFLQKFTYLDGVLRTAAIRHSDGTGSVMEFDKRGNRIENH